MGDEVKMDVQETKTSQHDKIYETHPLHVKIIIKIKADQGTTLELKFSYLQNLGCVVAKPALQGIHIDAKNIAKTLLDNNGLLDCLKANDSGTEIPNKSCQYLLTDTVTAGMESVFTDLGRPFNWAQNLCGLDFFSTNDKLKKKPGQDMDVSFKHVGSTIKMIRQRVVSRMTLVNEISSFAKCVVDCPHLKTETQSTLESWKPLTKEEYTVFTSINQNNTAIADIGIVDDISSFYLATLQHKWTKAKLEAAFALFPDHPHSVPLVTLNLSWKEANKTAMNDTNIREMEVHLNTGITTLISSKNMDHILSTQMSRMMSMLDVYMDNEIDTTTDNMQPAVMQHISNRSKGGKRSGPARLKPFYDHHHPYERR